jgi:hypothetical protein
VKHAEMIEMAAGAIEHDTANKGCISWGETKSLSERIVHEALPLRMK